MRYARETPIDPESLYLRPVATLCALLANINKGKGVEPFTARDFMQTQELLPFDIDPPDLTKNLMDFVARHNGDRRIKAPQ